MVDVGIDSTSSHGPAWLPMGSAKKVPSFDVEATDIQPVLDQASIMVSVMTTASFTFLYKRSEGIRQFPLTAGMESSVALAVCGDTIPQWCQSHGTQYYFSINFQLHCAVPWRFGVCDSWCIRSCLGFSAKGQVSRPHMWQSQYSNTCNLFRNLLQKCSCYPASLVLTSSPGTYWHSSHFPVQNWASLWTGPFLTLKLTLVVWLPNKY